MRKFIPMYRIRHNDQVAGYSFNKPDSKNKKTIKEEGVTFEHIRSEKDMTDEDRRIDVYIVAGLGNAMSFSAGVGAATFQGTHMHIPLVTHYENDDYLVMVDFIDGSKNIYNLMDLRLSQTVGGGNDSGIEKS